MGKKIRLDWGDGEMPAVMDLQTGGCVLYNRLGHEYLHELYGGRCFYTSRTELSGAGWFPIRPEMKVVATYRVDSARKERITSSHPDTILMDGWREIQVFVPVNYREERISCEWPLVVVKGPLPEADANGNLFNGGAEIYFLSGPGDDLLAALAGEGKWEEEELEISFLAYFSLANHSGRSGVVEAKAKILVRYRNCLPENSRRALVAIFNRQLAFTGWMSLEDQGEFEGSWNPFMSRLGLRSFRGSFYKIAQGVCWAKYSREELVDTGRLQGVSPRNVIFVSPDSYIQEEEPGKYVEIRREVGEDGQESYPEPRRLTLAETLKLMH